MNNYYNLIIAKFEEYKAYNNFVESVQEKFRGKRKELLTKLMEAKADEIAEKEQETFFDLQTEEKLFKQDAHMLFYELYKMVEVYLQLPDTIVLPKDVIETCESGAFTIPNTVYIIDEKGEAQEREKGKVDAIKNPWYKQEQMKLLKDNILRQLSEMTKQGAI